MIKKYAFMAGIPGSVASLPALADISVISVHNSAHTIQTSWLGVHPGLAAVGLLAIGAALAFRFKRAK